MSEEFSRQVLKIVVGKVCLPLGVHGMQTGVYETLTDVLKNYLLTLGKTTAAYCNHGECVGAAMGWRCGMVTILCVCSVLRWRNESFVGSCCG